MASTQADRDRSPIPPRSATLLSSRAGRNRDGGTPQVAASLEPTDGHLSSDDGDDRSVPDLASSRRVVSSAASALQPTRSSAARAAPRRWSTQRRRGASTSRPTPSWQGRQLLSGWAPRMDLSLRNARNPPVRGRASSASDDIAEGRSRPFISASEVFGDFSDDDLGPGPWSNLDLGRRSGRSSRIRSEHYTRIKLDLYGNARKLEQALIRRFLPRSPSPVPPAEYTNYSSDEAELDDGEEAFCSVCREDIKRHHVRLLECNHSFHRQCITDCFEDKKKLHRMCPNCRRCPKFIQRQRGGRNLVHFPLSTIPDSGDLSDFNPEKVREVSQLQGFRTGHWLDEAMERTITMVALAFERFGVQAIGPAFAGYYEFLAAAHSVTNEELLYDLAWEGSPWLRGHATKQWPPLEDRVVGAGAVGANNVVVHGMRKDHDYCGPSTV